MESIAEKMASMLSDFDIEIIEKQIERDPFLNKKIISDKALKLSEEQQNAYNVIEEAIEDNFNSEFLLFGVTGSRKNRSIFTINRKSIKK